MNHLKKTWSLGLAVIAWALFGVSGAFAQGNVDGYILGEVTSGSTGVANATVTVRNVNTGQERTTTTSDSGTYRISRLSTGDYEITVQAGGYRGASREVLVSVGQGTPADFSLVSGNVEQIVVTGANVAPVDVTLAETTTVFTAAEIERLPIPRDINAVALMAPGANLGDSRFGSSRVATASHYSTGFGLASFGGSSVGENVYYINGMNVTNFRNGLGGSTLPFEFYDQFQLKTGGFGAEFGRSTGGVLNAVTKRGTNEWRIRSGYITEPEALRGHSPDVLDPVAPGYDAVFSLDEKDETEAFFSIGGPIIQDKLFVYGIYQHRDIEEDDYTGGSILRRNVNDDPFWGGKIDWLINDNHTLELTAWSDESETIRTSYNYDEVSQRVGNNLGDTIISRGGRNYIGKYTGAITDDLTVAVMAGTSEYDLTTAAPADATCPYAYDSRQGGLTQIGCWTNALPEAGFDEREVYRIDVEYALNDRHLLRFGVDNETNTSTNTRAYSGPDGSYFRYYAATPGDTLNNGGVVPAGVTEIVRYRQLNGGGEFETEAESYYIEDEWLVTDTITARIGLRNERFNNKNSNGGTFIKVTDQWAPRLGIAWDVNGDGSSKLFANFGRYHLPIASNTNIRLSGSELFTEDWYTLGGAIDPTTGAVPLGDQIGPTNVYGDGSIPDVETTIDTGIEPMYQDEFIVGYETELGDGYVGSVTYTYRDLGQGIEDLTIDEALGAMGEFHYILANPGRPVNTFYDLDGDGVNEEYNFSAEELGFPEAMRKYHAVNFTLEKNWANGLYARANYTWSHSYGNYEGMVRSDNGQDDAGITTLYDFAGLLDGAYGDLPNDRRHAIKAFAAYEFAPGWQASLSGSYTSGRPRNAFGVHPDDPFAALYGAESFYNQGVFTPRASLGRLPGVKNIDLGVKYERDFGPNTLTFRADVFNIFNYNTYTEIDEVADEESGVAAATYGLPTWFQRPRAVRLGVTYDFGL
ncbi:MAG: TonB-dependent receptor [Pseudomonadales bacterium]|nr:TonB-dependent receptor [Pseudomonadales bacterium]